MPPCQALADMHLRALERTDWTPVLALNRASVRDLSEVDEQRLGYLLSLAHRGLVVEDRGVVVAFALAMAPGTAYDSRNYRWFDAHFERFLYLDRIAVAEPARRRGIGAQLYDAMETTATALDRMVCDVNVVPPNEVSLAFHAARGYREIGRLVHGPDKVVALMSKRLAREPSRETRACARGSDC
jgi:predicted GNAT superfamily acetyltransferase